MINIQRPVQREIIGWKFTHIVAFSCDDMYKLFITANILFLPSFLHYRPIQALTPLLYNSVLFLDPHSNTQILPAAADCS
jgi:hypothetical protein